MLNFPRAIPSYPLAVLSMFDIIWVVRKLVFSNRWIISKFAIDVGMGYDKLYVWVFCAERHYIRRFVMFRTRHPFWNRHLDYCQVGVFNC